MTELEPHVSAGDVVRESYRAFAARVGRPVGTIKRWAHEGMPTVTMGARVVVNVPEALAWAAARTRRQPPQGGCVYFARGADGLIKIGHTSDEQRAQQALERALADLKALESERAALEPTLRLEQPLAAADARIAELTATIADLGVELDRARSDLDALPRPTWPNVKHVSAAEAELAVAKAQHATALRRLTNVRAAAEAVEPNAAKVAAIHAELDAAHDEVADWQLLADGLGRDGVQALLIDAAGPELSELASDLLHTAFGTRFTLRFETTRLSADGKKLVEDCDVSVMDTERGREGSLDTFSGGEKVILSEAVALALTTLSCRQHGLTDVTIVRDESAAALDGQNAVRFMEMLRRARELASCRHLLFVSHNPATWELADARVEVAGGRVVVR